MNKERTVQERLTAMSNAHEHAWVTAVGCMGENYTAEQIAEISTAHHIQQLSKLMVALKFESGPIIEQIVKGMEQHQGARVLG